MTGDIIYPHRPDLSDKKFWRCEPCSAYVGCHRDGKPLGRLADAELRGLKMKAHEAFDPMWKRGIMDRNEAYRWLAGKMGISKRKCHIGMFTPDQCREVVRICGFHGDIV